MVSLPSVQEGKVIMFGENPFIWLHETKDGERTTEASIWTVKYSPKGSGHALFIKSELTNNIWKIYSDNPAMTRWIQNTIQGMLNPETADKSIEIIEASFSQKGDIQTTWSQIIDAKNEQIILKWEDIQTPILVQDEKVSEPNRPYGVNVVMIPANKASLSINGQKAKGQIWPMDLNGHKFSTGALAFCESWREN